MDDVEELIARSGARRYRRSWTLELRRDGDELWPIDAIDVVAAAFGDRVRHDAAPPAGNPRDGYWSEEKLVIANGDDSLVLTWSLAGCGTMVSTVKLANEQGVHLFADADTPERIEWRDRIVTAVAALGFTVESET